MGDAQRENQQQSQPRDRAQNEGFLESVRVGCLSGAVVDECFGDSQELIEAERLVEDRFSMQSGLPGFDDGVSGVVAEPGHQGHRDVFHALLQPEHQLVTRVVR